MNGFIPCPSSAGAGLLSARPVAVDAGRDPGLHPAALRPHQDQRGLRPRQEHQEEGQVGNPCSILSNTLKADSCCTYYLSPIPYFY